MEMKKSFLAEQWHKYRRKKTIWGIAFDFVFTVLLIAMLFPSSRRIVSSTIIRYSMFQPRETDELIYLKDADYEWYLTDMEGRRHVFSEFKDKQVFVNFWATWCPPCIAEMPSIQRLYKEYGDSVVFVLASREDRQTIKRFLEKRKYTFPVYLLQGSVPGIFASRSIPASFLISREGKVLMKKQGAARWDGKNVKQILDDDLRGQ